MTFRSSANTIRLTPLLATSDDPAAPQCNLLRIESLTLLLDCGVDVDLVAGAQRLLDAVAPHFQEIDAILISSSELCCCGGLALLLPRLRPGVRVIATMATARLGVMNVVSHFLSQFGNGDALMHRLAPARSPQREAPPAGFNVRAIYAAFRGICETHFEQSVTVHPLQLARAVMAGEEGEGGAAAEEAAGRQNEAAAAAAAAGGGGDMQAVVRAVAAGRCVGAAGFRIQFRDDDVLYLGRFAPRDSSCLPGLNTATHTQGAITGANIAIIDGSAAGVSAHHHHHQQGGGGAEADALQVLHGVHEAPPVAMERVLELVLTTLRHSVRGGGTVLLPVNAFGTGVELMHRLERYFEAEGLSYPLVFASPRAKEHVERLRLLSEFALESAEWGKTGGIFSRFALLSSAEEVQQQIIQQEQQQQAAAAAAAGKKNRQAAAGGDAIARCIVLHTHDCRDYMSALLLQHVCRDPNNLVLFTEQCGSATQPHLRPSAFPLREAILNAKAATAAASAAAAAAASKGKKPAAAASDAAPTVRFTALCRTMLEGRELDAYLDEERARRDAEDDAVEREEARRREEAAAAEQARLLQAAEEVVTGPATAIGGGGKNNRKNKKGAATAGTDAQQSSLPPHHPSMYISSAYTATKHVKPSVLAFPGDVAADSSRIVQDFGALAADNATLMIAQAANGGAAVSAEFSKEEAAIFGIPIRTADLRRFRRAAAETTLLANAHSGRRGEDGDEQDPALRDMLGKAGSAPSAEARDEVPAYIREVPVDVVCAARVETVLTNQWLDGTALRLILRNNCKAMRKIAFLHTAPQDARALLHFCAAESVCKRDAVFCPGVHDSQDLATAVYSCEIRIHPQLLQHISAQQRTVTTASGAWQVAWVRGALLHRIAAAAPAAADAPGERAGARRARQDDQNNGGKAGASSLLDEDPRPILCPLSMVPPEELAAAQERQHNLRLQMQQRSSLLGGDGDNDGERPHEAGSIFVGELRLPRIEQELMERWQISNVVIEHDDETPLLLANNSVAIRGGNRVAMEAIPSAAMFAARRAFRSSFSNIL